MNGWIKLHRELLNKKVWELTTPIQKTILVTLLLMANHSCNKWVWQGKEYECQPGEFISSAQKIANLSGKGVSQKMVRTALKKLQILDFLSMKTSKSKDEGIKVIINNWEIYQNQTVNDVVNEWSMNGQCVVNEWSTNKKEKNVNNEKNEKNSLIEEGDPSSMRKPPYKRKTPIDTTPYDDIVKVFNDICPSLPKIKGLSAKRKQKIKARWKEKSDSSYWFGVFCKAESSDFLTGRNSKSNWKASFDWIMANSENHLKIFEGNYDNKQKKSNQHKYDSLAGKLFDDIRKEFDL